MKNKLLIAGGGHSDIPLIKAAKRLGYYVITSGNKKEDLGHKHSDEYYPADFSDKEAILKCAKELKINAICSSCNDFSALSVAYTAEKLGLAGHDSFETSELIHHKDRYRKFAIENNIPSPLAMGFDNLDDALKQSNKLKFPSIVKPVDLTGGKGIKVVKTKLELRNALENAFQISKAKRVVVEEFIEGTRHGFSAFLYKGKITFYFSDNEHYYLNPYLVSAASSPSNVSTKIENELIENSERIAKLLNLKDGIFHIQFIVKENKPYIIEICRRAPGDLYIKLVEYVTGVDYASWIVKASAGIDCGDLQQVSPKGFYTRHCIMSSQKGALDSISYDSSIKKNIIDDFLWWEKGDLITDINTYKSGIVFLKFDSKEEMLNKTENMQDLIKVITTK